MPVIAPEIHVQRVPESVLDMAHQAVKDFHECFGWWNQDFLPASCEDVREIVLNLRKAGGHRAWQRTQAINPNAAFDWSLAVQGEFKSPPRREPLCPNPGSVVAVGAKATRRCF
jgi:hypothetical protein